MVILTVKDYQQLMDFNMKANINYSVYRPHRDPFNIYAQDTMIFFKTKDETIKHLETIIEDRNKEIKCLNDKIEVLSNPPKLTKWEQFINIFKTK